MMDGEGKGEGGGVALGGAGGPGRAAAWVGPLMPEKRVEATPLS